MESDRDAMSDSSEDEGSLPYSPYEDAKPISIVAPLPRRILEWKFPGNQVLLDDHHHMKLSKDAPAVGLSGGFLKRHIAYAGRTYTHPEEAAEAAIAAPLESAPADPTALFTLTARANRATVTDGASANDSLATLGNKDPAPWFRRSLEPEDAQQPASPPRQLPTMLCDDRGGVVRLPEPSEEAYWRAIVMQQEDDEVAFKMNHCPQRINPDNVQDPFGLGSMIGWAPYFMDDMPDAGLFKPIKSLVGGAEQVPLPFVCRRHEDVAPPQVQHQEPPVEAAQEPLPRSGITLSEYTNATGRYRDWSRLLIGLEMSSAQQSRGYFETAATGLVIIVHFLARHMDEFGLLPGSEEHNSNIRVAQSEKKNFWRRVHDLARRVVHQQIISMEQLSNDRPDLIPNKVHSAETPLTGQPYRQPGMLPEDWWTYGREVDEEWNEFFSAHYWGGTSLESPLLMPVPAHACMGSSPGCQNAQRPEMQLPLNIISPYTMMSLKEVLDQMHWILHGIPGRPVVGSEELFPLAEYTNLYNLVVRCCQDLQNLQRSSEEDEDLILPSRYYHRQMMRYTGRSYRHPLEEFSV